jgi:acyl-CoA oxidase
MLAMSDMSLMVKACVQWGLFGGAIDNLGTERHQEAYVRQVIDRRLIGAFSMTETGPGSDVRSVATTAVYDRETNEFIIDSAATMPAREYIGAAETGDMAAVLAQLITAGPEEEPQRQGVHCFLVPIRDENGYDLPA